LEGHLGFPLFARLPRKLELTEEGRQFGGAVREALTGIGSAIERLRADQGHGPLTISTMASFAAQWLMPRMSRFHALHPEIDIRLHTNDKMANLRTDGVDIALRHGWGDYPGLDTRLLMHERIFPVCSPKLMQGPGAVRKVEDLAHCVLLHDDDWRHSNVSGSWPFFLKQFGVRRPDAHGGPGFNQGDLMVQAAIHGRGVALARSSLAEIELDTGRLVRPLDIWLDSPMSLYVCTLPERAEQPKIVALRDWVMAEAQAAARRYGTL
jgi:LysR family glycine cleavage system transcriptional activator